MTKVHLIMPMGGAGLRFSQSIGFDVPKPLIMMRGYPFLYWAAKAVTDRIPVTQVSFIVLQEHVEKFNIDKVIKKFYPDADIAVLPKQLNGPVLTCYEGLRQIQTDDDAMLLINDCDHVFKSDELKNYITNANEPTNGLVVFKSDKPQFSYVRYNKDGRLIGTVEKRVVSSDAICGAYLFQSARLFSETAERYMSDGLGNYNEFYISGMYNILATNNAPLNCFKTDFHLSFGTPEEYTATLLSKNDTYFF